MAQRLGSTVAGATAADDDDRFRCARIRKRRRAWRRIALFADIDDAALVFHPPARDRIERRRTHRRACAKAEAGMMPRAADGIADEKPLRERSAVMRTGGGNRKYFLAASRQQDCLATDVSRQQSAVRQLRQSHSIGEIGPAGLGISFAHGFLPRLVGLLRNAPRSATVPGEPAEQEVPVAGFGGSAV